MGFRFIKIEFVEDEMQGSGKCLKIMYFFSDILKLCSSIFQLKTVSRQLGHGSGSLSLAVYPVIQFQSQHYHCGRVKFFPRTLVSPSYVLPQMLHTVLSSGAGAVGP
jgi:hypothetical protein